MNVSWRNDGVKANGSWLLMWQHGRCHAPSTAHSLSLFLERLNAKVSWPIPSKWGKVHPRGDAIQPLSRKRGRGWRRLFHPISLHCALLSRGGTHRFTRTAASRDRPRACHSVLQHRIPTFPVGGRSSTLWLRTWTQTAWVRSLAPPLPADLGQGAKASAAASVQWGQGHRQPQEVFSENFRRYILCHEQFVLCPLVLLCLSF